jgi:hypothetical protein
MNFHDTCIEVSYVTAEAFNCVPRVEYPEIACAVLRVCEPTAQQTRTKSFSAGADAMPPVSPVRD